MASIIKKTLLVGLGGAGKDTLRTIRRKFVENYGTCNIPGIDYLVLDTDRDDKGLMYADTLDSIDRSIAFKRIQQPGDQGEFIDLSFEKQNLDDFFQGQVSPELRLSTAWFNDRLRGLSKGILEYGAGGLRSIGKLALILHMKNPNSPLQSSFSHKLKYLTELDDKSSVWRKSPVGQQFLLPSDDTRHTVDVRFFFSTAGGTGAGTFLDVCYLMHYLYLKKRIIPGNALSQGAFEAFVYLPEIFIQDGGRIREFRKFEFLESRGITPLRTLNGGSFAALSELEAFQFNDKSSFSFDHGSNGGRYFVPDWESTVLRHGNLKPVTNDRLRGQSPFDWVHLVGCHSRTQRLAGMRDAIEMVADFNYLLLTDAEHDKAINTRRSNQHLYSLPQPIKLPNGESSQRFSHSYGSVGLAKIFVGRRKIQRWVSYYLADQFLEHLLAGKPLSDAEYSRDAERVCEESQWKAEQIYFQLAKPFFIAVQERFQSLSNGQADSYFGFVNRLGQGDDSPCFGELAVVENEVRRWIDQFDNDNKSNWERFEEELERCLLERGFAHAMGLLDAVIRRLENDMNIIRRDSNERIAKLGGFSEDTLRWFAEQQENLAWLGQANRPRDLRAVANILAAPLQVIAHLREVNALRPAAQRKVQQALQQRFKARFLASSVCSAWVSELYHSQDKMEKTAQSMERILAELVYCHRALLQAVNCAITLVITRLKALAERIRKDNENANDTLFKSLRDMRDYQLDTRRVGIRPELEALAQPPDKYEERDVYCGYRFQNPELIANPKPSPMKMGAMLKEAFGRIFNSGGEPLRRIWDMAGKPDIHSAIEPWIAELLASEVSRLTIEPNLAVYYNMLGSESQRQLRSDLAHILARSDVYLRHNTVLGSINSSQSIQLLYVPDGMTTTVRDTLGQDIVRIQGYQGSEIVSIKLENGVALPELASWQEMERAYQDFGEYQVALWTKGNPALAITTERARSDTRELVISAILLGIIEYDRLNGDFIVKLENRAAAGLHDYIPIGKSIVDAIAFFDSRRAENYTAPKERLRFLLEEAFMQMPLLRKLLPMHQFYQNFYFNKQQQQTQSDNPDAEIIKRLIEQRKNLMGRFWDAGQIENFNKESQSLYNWMHAYMELVPIDPSSDLNSLKGDFLPVLMRHLLEPHEKRKRCREILDWFNQYHVGQEERQRLSEARNGEKPVFAMSCLSRLMPFHELPLPYPKVLDEPEKLPADLHSLAWVPARIEKNAIAKAAPPVEDEHVAPNAEFLQAENEHSAASYTGIAATKANYSASSAPKEIDGFDEFVGG